MSDIVINVLELYHGDAHEDVPVPFHISLLPDKAFFSASKTLALTVRHTHIHTQKHTLKELFSALLHWGASRTFKEMKPSPVTSYISLLLKGYESSFWALTLSLSFFHSFPFKFFNSFFQSIDHVKFIRIHRGLDERLATGKQCWAQQWLSVGRKQEVNHQFSKWHLLMETCYGIERSSNLNDTTVHLIYTSEDGLLKRKDVFLWFTFFTSLNAVCCY